MAVVPIRENFEGWRALLAHVMEDDEIERFVIVTIRKDNTISSAHFEMTREQTAYAALLLQRNALE
jgi:hypothetical protein